MAHHELPHPDLPVAYTNRPEILSQRAIKPKTTNQLIQIPAFSKLKVLTHCILVDFSTVRC